MTPMETDQYAFKLNDDPTSANQIVVNDADDIDYESNPSIKLLTKADIGQGGRELLARHD